MADDVQPITGTTAMVAMRLCNFVTNQAQLLPAHVSALDDLVRPVIQQLNGPWVDLFGYASRRGPVAFNQQLSQRRLESVRGRIATYANPVNFQLQTAFGASQSGDDATDNSGYWRATDVYVYASRPPKREPEPQPVLGRNFEIRVVGGGSAAILAAADNYFFQIVDLDRRLTAFFFYTGGGFSISLPKIPGPGSMTFTGPPTKFTTTIPVELHQFNSKATLFQDAGATIGPLGIGGTYRLSIDEILDAKGSLAATRPSILPISGGSGIAMPGLGGATSGVLALVSEIFPFTGY